jgi:hypothetical protein
LEIRQLIREMSLANPLWGAPRIHGELLKLGIEIGQTSVAKYMACKSASNFDPAPIWLLSVSSHSGIVDLRRILSASSRDPTCLLKTSCRSMACDGFDGGQSWTPIHSHRDVA